jgi:RNA polymerase sigma factor (sigma-70 family)
VSIFARSCIARNAAIDFHRRRRPATGWERLPAALHPNDDRDLAAVAVQRESVTRLHQLLATLPPDKRELLALRFAADLSTAEIAAVIGRRPDATRKQLSRLLQFLEERYDDSPDRS